jgi:hypothetical protein
VIRGCETTSKQDTAGQLKKYFSVARQQARAGQAGSRFFINPSGDFDFSLTVDERF